MQMKMFCYMSRRAVYYVRTSSTINGRLHGIATKGKKKDRFHPAVNDIQLRHFLSLPV